MTARYLVPLAASLSCLVGCGSSNTPEQVAEDFVNAVRAHNCSRLAELAHPDEVGRFDCGDPELELAWPILEAISDAVEAALAAGEGFEVGESTARLAYDCPEDPPCHFELSLFDGDWYIADVD